MVFSEMDLRNGYLPDLLTQASMYLTAFLQQPGIPGVSIYLDDVMVHEPSTVLHDTCLEQAFRHFEQHRVTLNSEKCMFRVEDIESWTSGSRGGHHPDRVPPLGHSIPVRPTVAIPAGLLPGDGRLLPKIHATLL